MTTEQKIIRAKVGLLVSVSVRRRSFFPSSSVLHPERSALGFAGSPIVTADWTAAPGQQWTVPVGSGFGRVFKVGDQPIDASVQGFYNVVRPNNGPTWSLTATSRSGSRAARDGLQPWQSRGRLARRRRARHER